MYAIIASNYNFSPKELNGTSLMQVILAAELLKHAEELVKYKIHPTSIISGYRLACKFVTIV